jgi:hypothetical protein
MNNPEQQLILSGDFEQMTRIQCKKYWGRVAAASNQIIALSQFEI